MDKDEIYKREYPEIYNTAYEMLKASAKNNPDRGVSVVAIYTQVKGINSCATIKKMLNEVSWAYYEKSKYFINTKKNNKKKIEVSKENKIKNEELQKISLKVNNVKNKNYVLEDGVRYDKRKIEVTRIIYFGRELPNVNTWKELYARLVNMLVQDFPNRLPTKESFDGLTDSYDMCREDDLSRLKEPRRLMRGYYIETALTDTEIINKVLAVIKRCSLTKENVRIEYHYSDHNTEHINIESNKETTCIASEEKDKTLHTIENISMDKKNNESVKVCEIDNEILEKNNDEIVVISDDDIDDLEEDKADNYEGELNKRPIVQIDDEDGEDYFTLCVSDDVLVKKYYLYDSEGNQIVFDKKNFRNLQYAINKEMINERPKTSTFTEEELNFIEEQWTEVCCNLKDIQNNYKIKFDKNPSRKITERKLADIGYRVLGNYIVVPEDITDVDELILRLFENKKTVDFSDFDWILKNHTFTGRFNQYKRDYTYIEFDRNKYINVHMLKSDGLTKKIISDYCDKVVDFVQGRVFTLKSLRKHGFCHELDEFGFEDCFYESILNVSDKLKHSRHKGQYIFKDAKGTGCSYGILINEIILDRGSMDIYDLVTVLEEEYGIKMAWYDARNIGVEEGLYYSDTMEKLYLDYDDFYEEV